ncbi:MAG: DUF2066 domain-containing protein [Pseudomonadales bacterium]|nr:DUF2066 domain-containing protein [Pseudomonadales bacterium]
MKSLRCAWLLTLLLAGPAEAAQPIDWLYEADVPVANQSAQARVDAAAVAVSQVIARLSGQSTEKVSLAVSGADADRMMTRFSYHSEAVAGQRQQRIRFFFDAGKVLGLARQAGLPLWSSVRPEVRLFLLEPAEDGGLVNVLPDSPVAVALSRRAWERGLRTAFPEFTAGTVPVEDMLREASQPSGPAVRPLTVTQDLANDPPPEPFLPGIVPAPTEVVVVGRLLSVPAGYQVSGEPAFRFAWGEERDVMPARGETPEAQAVAFIDALADRLATRMSVAWTQPQPYTLKVRHLRDMAAYAALMAYLQGLEYVESVDVAGVVGDDLELTLQTPADAPTLSRLFSYDGLLLPVETATLDPESAFTWQG